MVPSCTKSSQLSPTPLNESFRRFEGFRSVRLIHKTAPAALAISQCDSESVSVSGEVELCSCVGDSKLDENQESTRITTSNKKNNNGGGMQTTLIVVSTAVLLPFSIADFTTARMFYQKQYTDYDPYGDSISVTEPDIDHYYHHHDLGHPVVAVPHGHGHRYRQPIPMSEKGLDVTSLGILAIIKLLLIKIKGMGLGLLLLLKLPIVLFTLFGKLLMFLKVAKFLKLLAIPFLLIGLVPLLLGPLLFLAPLLLPLLLALPIPVLQPANPPAAGGRRRRETYSDIDAATFLSLIESDRCLERFACMLATDNEPLITASIAWGLETLQPHITHPRMASYVSAYRMSANHLLTKKECSRKYSCKRAVYLDRTKSNKSKTTHNEQ